MTTPTYPTKQWRREYVQASREWPIWLAEIERVWPIIDHENTATPLQLAAKLWRESFPYASAHWWLANVREYGPQWQALPGIEATLQDELPLAGA